MKTVWIAMSSIVLLPHLWSGCTKPENPPSVKKTRMKATPEHQKSAFDILEWPRMKSNQFGCLLEKKLGHRDSQFNCQSEPVKDTGDPCKNTKAYYAGPKFPPKHASKIHPLVKMVRIDFEHGDLRMISLEFTRKIPEQEIRRIFSLPAQGIGTRQNLTSISIQDCHKNHNCLLVEGFDHMGAGEVDCPENDY